MGTQKLGSVALKLGQSSSRELRGELRFSIPLFLGRSQERMSRALNLFESWGTVSNPDSGLWQIAELLPGADAVAFAVHLQSGSRVRVSHSCLP